MPEDLETFLSALTSGISRNSRNMITEQQALKELEKLQKEKHIVLKACDKGAGILYLDYNEYVKACYKHLTSSQSDGNFYYTQVDALEVERNKAQIEHGQTPPERPIILGSGSLTEGIGMNVNPHIKKRQAPNIPYTSKTLPIF